MLWKYDESYVFAALQNVYTHKILHTISGSLSTSKNIYH